MSKEQMDAYLNKGNSTADYVNMVNQRSPLDDVGDAYSNFANKPTYSGKQRMTSAIMGGIGGGLKSAASSERKSKLAELEKANREVALLDASVKKNIGSAVNKQSQYLSVATNNIPTIDALTNAVIAQDQPAISDIMGTLVASVQSEAPDLLKGMGKYQKTIDGVSYFKTEDGKHVGFPMKQSLSNFISALPPEKQEQYMPLLSDVAQQKFKKRDMFDYAAIDEKRSSAAAHYASANQSNAHADYYNAQTKGLANPSKYSKETRENIDKLGRDFNKEISEKIPTMQKTADSYKKLMGWISEESEKGFDSRVGNSAVAALQRFVNSSDNEGSYKQALIELQGNEFLKDFKDIFGSKGTDQDLKHYLRGMLTADKDPLAALEVGKQRVAELNRQIDEGLVRKEVLGKINYSEDPYSTYVDELVNSDERVTRHKPYEIKSYSEAEGQQQNDNVQSTPVLKMKSSSGFEIDMTEEQAKAAEQKGWKRVGN